LVVVLALGLIAGGIGVAGLLWVKSVDDNLRRTESIDSMVTGERPPKAATGALNILLLGSDSRDPDQPTDEGGNWRTDTVVLMHIPASHDEVYLVSFPRDLWIHIPKSKSGPYGDTEAKINAATAWGGVPLMVETVEDYTGVRIDHLALIDFAGFVRVTDALGGVDMNIARTIKSIHPPYRTFSKGMNHLDGAEALDYVRQRKQFADGDFARMRHQQEFLKAVVDKAANSGTVTSVGTLTDFVSSVADAVTVDSSFSLIDIGWQFRSLRGSDLTFITSPHQGTGMAGDQSVVFPDPEKASSLFKAMNNDTVGDWLKQNPRNM
jgi:LCP family protein required for cell wall assembly